MSEEHEAVLRGLELSLLTGVEDGPVQIKDDCLDAHGLGLLAEALLLSCRQRCRAGGQSKRACVEMQGDKWIELAYASPAGAACK